VDTSGLVGNQGEDLLELVDHQQHLDRVVVGQHTLDGADQATLVLTQLSEQAVGRIDGDAQEDSFQLLQRMGTGQQLDDAPVLRARQRPTPQGRHDTSAHDTGFAAAAGSYHGEEACQRHRLAQASQQLVGQRFAAKEVGSIGFVEGAQPLIRIVEGRRGAIDGLKIARVEILERREVGRHTGSDDLEDMLGMAQAAQATFAKVAQLGVGRQVLAHELFGGEGEEGLTAVACGEEARDAVEGRAKVVAVALVGGAGVQRHTHTYGFRQIPLLPLKGALSGKGGEESGGRGRKGGIDGIADGLEDMAAVLFDGVAEDGVVAREGSRHGGGMLLPQPGGALNVGEEKGDGAGRKLRHQAPPPARRRSPAPASWPDPQPMLPHRFAGSG